MTSWKPGMQGEGIVEKLAFGGQGIVRQDDFVIFVPGVLPGQQISFQIRKKKENFAEAHLRAVVKKSPLEVQSPYSQMPGCTFQNLPYPEQLRIKEEQVYEALKHIAHIDIETAPNLERLPILPAPEIFRYRNRVEFSFGYGRMWIEHTPEGRIFHDEDPTLGFHPAGKWDLVQPMEDCFLISEALNQIKKLVWEFAEKSKLPVWNQKTGRGFWRGLLLREGENTGDILVNILVSAEQKMSFWEPLLQKLTKNFPPIVGILETVQKERNPSPTDAPPRALMGQDFISEKLEEVSFQIKPFSFFQTNTTGATALFGQVREFAELTGQEAILDLFCGCGAIGLFLAPHAKKIIGADIDPEAITAARHNAENNGIGQAEYLVGAIERIFPLILQQDPADLVIVDPPRAGLHPRAAEFLAEYPAQKMIMISCNPSTFARDLTLLQPAGWQLEKIRPVDMFPHTPHIEVVAVLRRM